MHPALIDKSLVDKVNGQFVLELAAKIQPPAELLKRYGISKDEFAVICKDPQFKNAYKEAKAFWHSDTNLHERIKVKAGYMVEDALMDIFTEVVDKDNNLSQRLEAFKTLTKMGGVSGETNKGQGEGMGQRVQISINLGGHAPIEREVSVQPQPIEAEGAG